MYRSIDDFANDWQHQTAETLRIFDALTDASLSQAVIPAGRTLGFLAWHITCTNAEMGGQAGLAVEGPIEEHGAPPSSVAAIIAAYKTATSSLLTSVRTEWTDLQLGDLIPMYGQEWPKGLVLSVFLHHQTHHRGQMTVLMRQAGLKVPGVVGPSAEEWQAMGLPARP